jgi:flagellar basal-body rod protein FlgB
VSDLVSVTLQRALDGLALRQQVIGDNIANVDTPGFRAKTVDFESALQSALASGSEDHAAAMMESADPLIGTTDAVPTANGNNVSLANETMNATQALVQYQLVTRAVNDRFGLLKTAIGGQ